MRKKINSFFIRLSYILIDISIIYVIFFVSCLIRNPHVPFDVKFSTFLLDQGNPFRLMFIYWTVSLIFLNQVYGLYQTRREQLESFEIWAVTKSVFFSSLIAIVCAYVLKIQGFPRSVFMLNVFLLNVFLSLWRVIKKSFVEYLVSQGYNNLNALIIGAGKVGVTLAQELEKRPGLGIKVVGFLDDFKSQKDSKRGESILGDISKFHKIAREEFINTIFITIHHDSRVFLKLLKDARDLGIAIKVIPQGFDLIRSELNKYNIGIIPILEYCDEELLQKQGGKRLFDIILSTFLLLLLFPVFVFMGIIIKLDSSGPVFYLSKRYGRKGKIFKMFKFRSMVNKADDLLKQVKDKNEVDGPIFKIKKDPRVTEVGALLRRYSLDELPQIINVLRGDMSLVGPRPLPIDQVEKEDFRQLKRLDVRPGITGLWQIRGRSDLPFARLLKWDIWYINNWSFGLDLNILLQTIPVVIKGKGAY